MIVIAGTIRMPGAITDAALDSLEKMMAASRAEDGCIDYTFARDICDPSVIVLFERWRDDEALAAHNASPHMAAFRETMAANPPAARDLRLYRTDGGQPI